MSGEHLTKETGALETIAERNQSTVEVQGEIESEDGKPSTREEQGGTGTLGKVVVANQPARDKDKCLIG